MPHYQQIINHHLQTIRTHLLNYQSHQYHIQIQLRIKIIKIQINQNKKVYLEVSQPMDYLEILLQLNQAEVYLANLRQVDCLALYHRVEGYSVIRIKMASKKVQAFSTSQLVVFLEVETLFLEIHSQVHYSNRVIHYLVDPSQTYFQRIKMKNHQIREKTAGMRLVIKVTDLQHWPTYQLPQALSTKSTFRMQRNLKQRLLKRNLWVEENYLQLGQNSVRKKIQQQYGKLCLKTRLVKYSTRQM